ncbi:MAG: peroxiredoxin [Pseudomonadales bacterium]|nr:peroxiredoxin [Pseudomonadales bacterium]
MSIEEGKRAPDFCLGNTDGNSVSLSDFRGNHVVVFFYPRDDTPGCTKEACGFRDRWTEFQQAGVALLGISPDAPASHRRFADKYRLPFTLLCDEDRSVMTKYQAYGKKVMYGREVVGVIRSTVWIGPDGNVRRHWRRVAKAADHPQKVLEAVKG